MPRGSSEAGEVADNAEDALTVERQRSEREMEIEEANSQSLVVACAFILSHDLNQPLSAAANFLATARVLMSQQVEQARVLDVIRQGEEQILRAGKVLRALRDPDDAQPAERETVNIDDVLRTSSAAILLGSEPFGIVTSFDLDAAAPRIMVDSAQVQDVVLNLVRNAVSMLRTTPATAARNILITSRPGGEGMVEISVEHTCEVLDKDALGYRGTAPPTDHITVPQMRLSISRRIVEMHGGDLVCETVPGRCSAVRFTVPAVAGSSTDHEAPARPEKAWQHNGRQPHDLRPFARPVEDQEGEMS